MQSAPPTSSVCVPSLKQKQQQRDAEELSESRKLCCCLFVVMDGQECTHIYVHFTTNCLRQVNGVNGRDTVFVRCVSVSVCLYVCSRMVSRISLKRLKLRTSNLPCLFPETVRTWTVENFWKGGVTRVTWPPNFWALNASSSKMVKAMDFKFDLHVSRDVPDVTP